MELTFSPVWSVPTNDRAFTVNLSMLRLTPRDLRVAGQHRRQLVVDH